jgi:hypothetical protein
MPRAGHEPALAVLAQTRRALHHECAVGNSCLPSHPESVDDLRWSVSILNNRCAVELRRCALASPVTCCR